MDQEYYGDLGTLDYSCQKYDDQTTLYKTEMRLNEMSNKTMSLSQWAQECGIENYLRGNTQEWIINAQTHNFKVELNVMDNMHQKTDDFGLTYTEYNTENEELVKTFESIKESNPNIKSIKNYKYLTYSIPATQDNQLFKEADLDLLAFVTNLFNHTFTSVTLYVQKNPQNPSQYIFKLSSNYLIDDEQTISKNQFYEIVLDIIFIANVSLEISLMFQSIEHSKKQEKRKMGKDYTIEEIILKYFERMKPIIKSKLKNKSLDVQQFIAQNQSPQN